MRMISRKTTLHKSFAKALLATFLVSFVANIMPMATPSLAVKGAGKPAGILPTTTWMKPEGPFDPKTKKKKMIPIKYAILGREAGGHDKGTYADFGGGGHGKDHPKITAAREFAEEAITEKTIGMNEGQIINYADPAKVHTEYILVGPSGSTSYITRFDNSVIGKLMKNFEKERSKQTSWKYKEKDRIATVRWEYLKNAVKNAALGATVTVTARVVDPKTGKGRPNTQQVTLRSPFVRLLKRFFDGKPYTKGSNPKIRFY